MKTKIHNRLPPTAAKATPTAPFLPLPQVDCRVDQLVVQALDALLRNIEQDAHIKCAKAQACGHEPADRDVLMNVAAQLARRMVKRARAAGKSDDTAIAEMLLSDSPQLRAIGDDAAWLRRWAR